MTNTMTKRRLGAERTVDPRPVPHPGIAAPASRWAPVVGMAAGALAALRGVGLQPGSRSRLPGASPGLALLLTLVAVTLMPIGQAIAQDAGALGPPTEQDLTGSDFLSADGSAVQAADKMFGVEGADPSAEQRGWSGQAQLGFAASTGNADNTSLNAAVRATYRNFPWRHILTGEVLLSEDEGTRTAERYAGAYKINYFFNQRLFSFGFVGADRDEFADIDLRYSAVVGLGYGLIQTARHDLDLELGVGGRQTSYVSDLEDTDSVVGHFALRYKGQLTDNTSVSQDILVQAGDDNTFTQSITALQVAMNSQLAISVNFTVLNNSDPSEGFDSTDTFTSVNLVANF